MEEDNPRGIETAVDFLVGAGVQRAVTSTEFNQTNVTKILHKQQQTTMDDDENEYNDRRELIHA